MAFFADMEPAGWWLEFGLAGLFLASFLAATVVPFSSEAVLAAAALGPWPTWELFLVASVGNTLGGMSSYALGHIGDPGRIARWLRTDPSEAVRWQGRIQRYGVWAALLTWLPLVGDVIAIALGLARARALPVAVLMFLGKAARYGVVLAVLRP